MPSLHVICRDGTTRELPGEDGASVMEMLRAGGVDELLALCGGCCSCATCHIYIDATFLPALPDMSDEEDDLLESSDHRRAESRLSCQLHWSKALDGLTVMIAPED